MHAVELPQRVDLVELSLRIEGLGFRIQVSFGIHKAAHAQTETCCLLPQDAAAACHVAALQPYTRAETRGALRSRLARQQDGDARQEPDAHAHSEQCCYKHEPDASLYQRAHDDAGPIAWRRVCGGC